MSALSAVRRARRGIPPIALMAALLAPVATAQQASSLDQRINLQLDGASLAEVLESFAIEHRINLVVGPEVTGKVTLNLFDVKIEDALRVMLEANGFGYRKTGDFFHVMRLDQLAVAPLDDPLETRIVWLDWLRAEDTLRLIEPLKSTDGKYSASTAAETGLASDAALAGGNTQAAGEVLVLRDKRSVLDAVVVAIREIDRRPREVLVEAVILEVSLNDETQLGIDFNTLGGIDFTDLGGISNLNSVLTTPVSDPLHFQDGVQSAGTYGFASDVNTDGFHVGYLKDDIGVFLEALERVTDATVLASPRVLALDRQKAEIIIGSKLGYKSSTTTETATVEEVEFLDVGTQLRFRPFVSSDGLIRFEIHPENSTGVVDPSSGLPSETTTEVTTNVVVRDGSTIAIGGLISDQVQTVVKQVPFLGSIPLIGVLFRQTRDEVRRREIIVLMTPHIVDPEQRDSAGIAEGDSLAMARDLVLRNQLPLSRARLAKPLLERAELCLESGDPRAAARLADAVLSLLPADVRAIKLRRDALARLGLPDREARALEALEGLEDPR
jgi:type IV pilus assembly protein PilQ